MRRDEILKPGSLADVPQLTPWARRLRIRDQDTETPAVGRSRQEAVPGAAERRDSELGQPNARSWTGRGHSLPSTPVFLGGGLPSSAQEAGGGEPAVLGQLLQCRGLRTGHCLTLQQVGIMGIIPVSGGPLWGPQGCSGNRRGQGSKLGQECCVCSNHTLAPVFVFPERQLRGREKQK